MSLVFGQPERVMRAIWAAQMADPAERDLAEQHGLTMSEWARAHSGADVVGVAVRGELAGGMFFLEGEVHVGILPSYRGQWVRDLRRMLEHGFKLHGSPLRARVNVHNRAAQVFVERVGCLMRGKTEQYFDYEVSPERLNHVLSH